jgi:hypothetical protein
LKKLILETNEYECVANFVWNLSNCCQISNESLKKIHESQPLVQEFWIWMSLLTLFSLSTGRVEGTGPRVECSAKISMFFICQILLNFVRFFFIICLLIYFRKGPVSIWIENINVFHIHVKCQKGKREWFQTTKFFDLRRRSQL